MTGQLPDNAITAETLRSAVEYARGARDAALEAALARTDDNGIWAQAKGNNAIARLTRKSILRAALEAAAPVIAAQATRTERAKLAAVMSPDQFRKLADWFDTDDEFKEAMFPETWSPGSRQDEVQRDLRRFADLLDGTQ